MAIPVLPLILAAAAIGIGSLLVGGAKKAAPGAYAPPSAPPPGMTYDPGMSQATTTLVTTALASENDPGKLNALAAQLAQAGYKTAAALVQAKANAMAAKQVILPQGGGGAPVPQGGGGGQPPAPYAPPSPIPQGINPYDPGMSPTLQGQVTQALQSNTDPATLNTLAGVMGAQGYPIAASMLQAKAALLSLSVPIVGPPAPGGGPETFLVTTADADPAHAATSGALLIHAGSPSDTGTAGSGAQLGGASHGTIVTLTGPKGIVNGHNSPYPWLWGRASNGISGWMSMRYLTSQQGTSV
jgi:hypothetical protein